MNQPRSAGPPPARTLQPYGQSSSANLADILERVLDKGIVIVGDIKIDLLDIELLTIRIRLLVASVDKAREIGIDWWERDPSLSSRADGSHDLAEQNARLRAEVEELRRRVPEPEAELPTASSGGRRSRREPEREPAAEPRRRKRRPEERSAGRSAARSADRHDDGHDDRHEDTEAEDDDRDDDRRR
ncbi:MULTISPECIES: gas vesicle protein [Streptomyces]|uniref:gas vesicle protein n=1 Tax=Streptomyces TaxID=1883 RepID=UPI00099D1964|nr:gas vesicle protein [Streptomyces sp. AS58]